MTRKTRAKRNAYVYVHAASFNGSMQRVPQKSRFATLKPKMLELLDRLDTGTEIRVQPGGPLHQKLIEIFRG